MNKFGVIDTLSEKLSKIKLTKESKSNKTKMNTDQAFAEQIKLLQNQISSINIQLSKLDHTVKVEEYQEIKVQVSDVKDISLDMFKTLPEFKGERNSYTAWRNSACNVMKIFNGLTDKPKYFEALNILRNKIVGPASEALTNYNTVFNFDAIISRLDFTYADKRPIYIIEQEMIVLQQKDKTIMKIFMMK